MCFSFLLNMEDSLARIRAQLDSGLSNQKQVAVTLWAVEETLREQGVAFSPSAYFAALVIITFFQAMMCWCLS